MIINDIMPILEGAFQVGFMEAVRAYEPAQDRIRRTDVKLWLKMMRIEYKRFKTLVDNGVIKPFRIGEGRNSPLYFSKRDIKKAVMKTDIAAKIISQNL